MLINAPWLCFKVTLMKLKRSSGGQFGVAGRRKLALQVFDDVQRQAADQRDHAHLPQERPRGDERQI